MSLHPEFLWAQRSSGTDAEKVSSWFISSPILKLTRGGGWRAYFTSQTWCYNFNVNYDWTSHVTRTLFISPLTFPISKNQLWKLSWLQRNSVSLHELGSTCLFSSIKFRNNHRLNTLFYSIPLSFPLLFVSLTYKKQWKRNRREELGRRGGVLWWDRPRGEDRLFQFTNLVPSAHDHMVC